MDMKDVLERLDEIERKVGERDIEEQHDEGCPCTCDLTDAAESVLLAGLQSLKLDIEIDLRRQGVELVTC